MFAQNSSARYQNTHRTYNSRLTKKERWKNLRTTILMSALTAGLLAALVYWGFPLAIKLTEWWTGFQTNSVASSGSDDKVAPTMPRLLLSTRFTNQDKIEIKGFGEAESVVTIVLNGEAVSKATVEANGGFSITDVMLTEGKNEINAYATDKANNESQLSQTETIVYDKTPPKLEIVKPTETVFRGAQSQTVEIEGTVNEDVRVWINERLAIIDQGIFRSSFRLNEGEQEVIVKAVDPSGNESATTLMLTYQP